jgi:predicted nucleic acid-binding protein
VKAKAPAAPVLHVVEPPPGYLGRPPVVVDCSVLSAVLFDEPTRNEASGVLSGKAMHAPILLDSEVVSVAAKKKKAGMAEKHVALALADYVIQDIEFHRVDVQAQYELAMRYGISTYDAAYLWVSGLLQAPLATFDAKLAKAARAHLAGPS